MQSIRPMKAVGAYKSRLVGTDLRAYIDPGQVPGQILRCNPPGRERS
jgi:hypothetical protein